MRGLVTAMAAALALAACTPLTSEHPLFSHADEVGPSPLSEGLWVGIDENCTREMAARAPPPESCDQFTLRHTASGWRLSAQDKDDNGAVRTLEFPIVVVPAVPTEHADAYAPLYIVEVGQRDADPKSDAPPDQRIYAVVAPIGVLPAQELFVTEIDCAAILREGPIDGVSERRGADGALSGCVAANQAAVREAARRTVIENLSGIDHNRMVLVRP